MQNIEKKKVDQSIRIIETLYNTINLEYILSIVIGLQYEVNDIFTPENVYNQGIQSNVIIMLTTKLRPIFLPKNNKKEKIPQRKS